VGGKEVNCFTSVRIRTPEPCPRGAGEAVPRQILSQQNLAEGEIPLPPTLDFFINHIYYIVWSTNLNNSYLKSLLVYKNTHSSGLFWGKER
jgi:hypothetical protein